MERGPGRGLERHALALSCLGETPCGLRDPPVTDPGALVGALVEHDPSFGGRTQSTVDQRQGLLDGEGVQPRDEIDILVAVGEGLRVLNRPGTEEVRIVDMARRGDALARQAAIEQGQLGIDARHRASWSRAAGDPQWHALGEHDVQHAILEPPLAKRRGDRLYDPGGEFGPRDRVLRGHPDPDDVGLRHGTLRDVVLADFSRGGTRVVDDDRDVLT